VLRKIFFYLLSAYLIFSAALQVYEIKLVSRSYQSGIESVYVACATSELHVYGRFGLECRVGEVHLDKGGPVS
jgi:hypothetical protein